MTQMLDALRMLYGTQAEEVLRRIIARYGQGTDPQPVQAPTQADAMLITYGDTLRRDGEKPLRTLERFLINHVGSALSAVHLLPIYPYSSDDGFSVIDYHNVSPALGDWDDVQSLAGHYNLMLDAVINHASRQSAWFRHYLNGDQPYDSFFITCDPAADYTAVVRPRALPLLTRVQTTQGLRMVWTTFSDDQIDLNFRSPELLLEILNILLDYAHRGARFIRLDAIGFAWKEPGTSCMNLPQTHALVRLFHAFLARYVPGTLLITETNVPSEENLAYLGNGHDEADLVYQFPLPPLTLHAFLAQDATYLTRWAEALPIPEGNATFFNFLASHDGIGLRPVEGILPEQEVARVIEAVQANGGLLSCRDAGNGKQRVYELNISYIDALTSPDATDDIRAARFLAAHTLLLSLAGVPGIYIHSLLGSRNARQEALDSGVNRRINRAHLDADELETALQNDPLRKRVFIQLIHRLNLRRQQPAFHPKAHQQILCMDKRAFCLLRTAQSQQILAIINVSTETIQLSCSGHDLLSNQTIQGTLTLGPLQCAWVEQPVRTA